MRSMLWLVALLAGCSGPTPEETRKEAARFRASLEKYRAEYVKGIEKENLLARETLAWLKGAAVTGSHTRRMSDARQFTDRWARVYFVPRTMHEQLRFDRYASPEVRAVQGRVLEHLRTRYFELHEYQRYAQGFPAGHRDFERRLEVREVARDELFGLLAWLP
ncbi:MAG: hypothetical protein JST93_35825 [Acidobacteria bacterium]|nr:hypothetical protein [Acidobacteriota bacterium]